MADNNFTVRRDVKSVIKIIILTFLLLFIWVDQTVSLGLSSARSMGLGGAYTAVARNEQAPFWNPANLSFKDNRAFSLNLFSLGALVENNAFSLKDYNNYNGRFWYDNDKNNILGSIPSTGLNLDAQAEACIVGLAGGSVALVSWISGVSDISLPKEPIELLLLGNQVEDTISLEGTSGEAYAYGTLSFSFGQSIYRNEEKEIGIGVNLKILHGIIYRKIVKASGQVRIKETEIEGESDLVLHRASGGRGYGIDLGIAAKKNEKLTFSFFLSNPFSQIKWDTKPEERGYRFQVDSLNLSSSDNDSVILSEDYEKRIEPFVTHLPLIARAGFAYQAKKILLSFDWEQGFENGPGVSRTPRFSLGTELKLVGFLPLRGGITAGGKEKLALSGGTGLDLGLLYLDIGIANKNAISPGSSKGLGFSLGLGFRF
ncbi:MAG: DUF5723 family protein [candidate division Zixibacteria bacterium]|nr:DUF5723 family protein [candidate division Zixibacteria bacterium]